MKLSINGIVLLVLMLLAAGLGSFLRPTIYLAKQQANVNLEQMITAHFGDWREVPQPTAQIINPQQAENLGRTYSATLSRTYIDSQRRVIMMSIAYGDNQSREAQLHKPETCYPAQGFDLKFSRPSVLHSKFGALQTTQVFASLGTRREPITYWMRVGDSVMRGGFPQTVQRLKLGLFQGAIADGLLFRVSDISGDPDASFTLQEDFIRSLLDAASPELRQLLIGAKLKAEG
jgi:EpsI family protein